MFAGVLFAMVSAGVLADDQGANTTTDQLPEDYTYDTHLDISKIISMTEPAQICSVTPMVMVYEDSHGERHSLRYQVMGTGCSGG